MTSEQKYLVGLAVGIVLVAISASLIYMYKINTWWGFLVTMLCFALPFCIGMWKAGMFH